MDLYNEIIDNLRMRIEVDYGSVLKFADKTGISRFNLSRVFNRKHDISVSLYIQINAILGVLPESSNVEFKCNLSLREYMNIDHGNIVKSLFANIAG